MMLAHVHECMHARREGVRKEGRFACMHNVSNVIKST